MQRVVISSKNIVKLTAAQLGFENMFPGIPREVIGISVSSGVADQPMGDEETLRGANNRLTAIKAAEPAADFWVAIEGGCAWDGTQMSVFAWVVIENNSQTGQARTAAFYLPPKIAELVS
jgi:inosine/xanthosine triphosphatase